MNNNLRTCPNCGNNNSNNSLFCISCGNKFEQLSNTNQESIVANSLDNEIQNQNVVNQSLSNNESSQSIGNENLTNDQVQQPNVIQNN